MLVNSVSLRLLGLIAGSGLYGFCVYLFLSRREKSAAHWGGLGIAAIAAFWNLSQAAQIFFAIFTVNAPLPEEPGADWIGLSLLPVAVFIWRVRRAHILGLFIRRRMVVAVGMSLITAVYLLLVRNVARYAEGEFDAFGRLLEVALILAAAVLWLPLYAWLSRRQARRLEAHAAFSKQLMDEAAAILESRSRMRFMAERVRVAFGLKQLILIAGDQAETGPVPDAAELRRFEAMLMDRSIDLLFAASPEFNYIFPLRYEDRLLGLCLVDSTPRYFLDEDETALVSLCRQMSHSIEACHRVEERIQTETLLLRQEHLAMVGTLAASIAHEVKNPLSAIKTLVQVMAETPDLDAHMQQDLSFVRSEIDRLSACVQQLLTYSRPLSQQAAVGTLGEVTRSAAMLLENDHGEKQIRVECRVAPDVELERVDFQAVQQVILNLGLNAAQSVATGGLVQLGVSRKPDGSVELTVSDDGPGILPSEQEKIFEPFYSTKARGTGLGLAIVKKNVKYLGGTVALCSPLSARGGTRFTVLLPHRP